MNSKAIRRILQARLAEEEILIPEEFSAEADAVSDWLEGDSQSVEVEEVASALAESLAPKYYGLATSFWTLRLQLQQYLKACDVLHICATAYVAEAARFCEYLAQNARIAYVSAEAGGDYRFWDFASRIVKAYTSDHDELTAEELGTLAFDYQRYWGRCPSDNGNIGSAFRGVLRRMSDESVGYFAVTDSLFWIESVRRGVKPAWEPKYPGRWQIDRQRVLDVEYCPPLKSASGQSIRPDALGGWADKDALINAAQWWADGGGETDWEKFESAVLRQVLPWEEADEWGRRTLANVQARLAAEVEYAVAHRYDGGEAEDEDFLVWGGSLHD